MNCSKCQSNNIRKNGHRRGKQNYQCKDCGRQFVESHSSKGYSPSVKKNCLKMYVNGLGFRAIERVTGVNHNTVIRWVRKSATALPNAPQVQEIPEITEIDGAGHAEVASAYAPHELQTFVGKKNEKMALDNS